MVVFKQIKSHCSPEFAFDLAGAEVFWFKLIGARNFGPSCWHTQRQCMSVSPLKGAITVASAIKCKTFHLLWRFAVVNSIISG